MKKTIFTIIFSMILICIMLLIPNRVNAETIIDFDYSKIKASTDLALPKLYDLDSSIGEILNQDWKDDMGESLFSSYKGFEIGKTYTYTAEIRLNDPDAFMEIKNPPPAIEGCSYSVSRTGVDTIVIEIVTVIPKEYKLTINITDGIIIDGFTPNISKEFVVYEMEEFTLDFDLEDEYEVILAEANGNLIFENDAYFDDTFAHIFENKLKVWNINTDVEIIINAEKIKPVLKVNLSANDVYIGDSAEDVNFKIDYDGLKISKIEVGELVEFDNGVEFKEFIGKFEANKKYIAIVTLKLNITQEEFEKLAEKYSNVILYYNDMPLELDYVFNDEGLAFCELSILDVSKKEDNTINNNTLNNTIDNIKDDTPKTGDNVLVIIKMLALLLLGCLIIKK